MIYTCLMRGRLYVAEAYSREEAVIKFFNQMTVPCMGGVEITECPIQVSTPETRAIQYGELQRA